MRSTAEAKPILTEAATIAAAPALCYGMVFLYEWGYCREFGIPSGAIAVSFGSVFVVLATVISSILLVLALWNMAFILLYPEAKRTRVGRQVIFTVQYALVVLGYQLLSKSTFLDLFPIWVALAAATVFNFAFHILAHRRRRTYEEKLRAQAETEAGAVRHLGLDEYLISFLRPIEWSNRKKRFPISSDIVPYGGCPR